MRTPIVLNLEGIPEVIVGTIELSEKIEQAIIEGELVLVPDYGITKNGEELMAFFLESNQVIGRRTNQKLINLEMIEIVKRGF